MGFSISLVGACPSRKGFAAHPGWVPWCIERSFPWEQCSHIHVSLGTKPR